MINELIFEKCSSVSFERKIYVGNVHVHRDRLCLVTHFLPMSSFVTVLLKFDLKKEGIMEKNSYECRAYESVDNRSLSKAMSQKQTGKCLGL